MARGIELLEARELDALRRRREAAAAYRAWIAAPSPADEPLMMADAQTALGKVLVDLGDLEAARVELRRAREAVEAKLGRDADKLVWINNLLGQLETFAGNRDAGLAHFREGLRISDAARSKVPAQIAAQRANIGWWHLAWGEPEVALPILRESVDQLSKVAWINQQAMYTYKLWLSRCLNDLGRGNEAAKLLDGIAGDEEPIASARFEMARARFLAGDKDALADARSAVAAVPAENSSDVFQIPRMRAWIAEAEGG